jgi:hypothetical protein
LSLTHLVLKHEDIDKFLNDEEKQQLTHIVRMIGLGRIGVGKQPYNSYLVVNEDEKYAKRIRKIIMKYEGIRDGF